MKIIGHRGAAGYELENTLSGIQEAKKLGVYAIEFDVRKTKDHHIVLCHDADLMRVAGNSSKLKDLTLKELQKIPLLDGSHMPSLEEALEVAGRKRVIIEIKERGTAKLIVDIVKKFPYANAMVVSHKLSELVKVSELSDGKISAYGSETTKPFDIIREVKRRKLDGVSLNYWMLNPATYLMCKRNNLPLMVWTVNHRFQVWFLSRLYPDIAICTDYPARFMKHRKRYHVNHT